MSHGFQCHMERLGDGQGNRHGDLVQCRAIPIQDVPMRLRSVAVVEARHWLLLPLDDCYKLNREILDLVTVAGVPT